MVATDLFGVDTVLLRRFYLLVFIELDTRFLPVAGITANPVSSWVTQQARNLCFELPAPATPIKFLIRDGDAKFPASFDEVLRAEGIRILKTPVRAPRANAVCERVIATLGRECLDRMLIFGHRHLEVILAEYVDHYNAHRPHRCLGQRCPSSPDRVLAPLLDVEPHRLRRADRLGGVIHEYRMVA